MNRSVAVLAALALAAHVVGLANGFVYDDHRFIVDNPALPDMSWRDALLDQTTHTADWDQDVYRPLRVMGHAFDLRRWGLDPFGFHLHSILVHVAAVLVTWLALRRLLSDWGEAPALLGAATLAMHPVGVEVVGWVSSRGDLYAVLCGMGALALAAGDGRRGALVPTAVLCGVLTGLATLGKESAAVVPAVAALHHGLVRRRSWWLPAAMALGVVAATVLRQMAVGGATPVQTPPHGGDHLTQAGWALFGLGRTLTSLVATSILSIDHDQDGWAAAGGPWARPTTLAALALATVPWWFLRTGRRRRALAFTLAWVLLAYLPSSSLLVTLRSLVTDRAAYPLLAPVGASLGLLLTAVPRRGAPWAALALASLVWVPAAMERTAVFRDDAALWTDALRTNPRSVRAQLGLASSWQASDPHRAGHHLRAAVDVAVDGSKLEAVALARFGDHMLRNGDDPAAAVPILERALAALRRWRDRERASIDEPATAATLAEALTLVGRHEDAEAVLGRAIADHADPTMLLVKQALLRAMRSRSEENPKDLSAAWESLRRAEQHAPRHPLVRALREWLAQEEGEAGGPP